MAGTIERIPRWLGLLLLGILLFSAVFAEKTASPAAAPRSGALTAEMRRVFQGFAYSGVYACRQMIVPEHAYNQYAWPHSLELGRCYVFHAPAGMSAAHQVLVSRFRSEKIELVHYPQNNADLVYTFSQGPLFRIDFRACDRAGSVLVVQGNHPESAPPGWRLEDYVLRLEN